MWHRSIRAPLTFIFKYQKEVYKPEDWKTEQDDDDENE